MKALSTVILFLLSSLSVAEDFIEFETSVNQISSYYRAYIFFEGDDKYKDPILKIISEASNFDELLNDKPQLKLKWSEFVDQLHRGLEDENSSLNINAQGHWEIKAYELNNALNNEVEGSLDNKQLEDPHSEQYVRLLLLKMERILTSYMALTNVMGSVGIMAGSVDLNAQIIEVSEMLILLNPQDASLKRVEKKWAFIKKVLLKYNTNLAPFIVLHSYKKMRVDINTYLVTNITPL
jgi:hypothetical protein